MEQIQKTETKSETLNRLFKENGLLPEDVHKHNHYTIITRQGIEKIQAKNKVRAHYEAIVMERDFAVIKGTFSKEGVPDLETFGSASKETSQNKYYAEMAEKRCLSRGVLKICKFYELGVYGEDEADDFRKKTGEAMESQNKPAESTQSVKPIQDKGKQEKAQEKPANAATAKQQELILKLNNSSVFTAEEKAKIVKALPTMTVEKAAKCIEYLQTELKTRKEATHAS